ncbi:MAG: hypothetical protein EXR69_08755 [Myxococcales bacterium]|nr:hypothetical protein [Myxococcales bacterium]
MNKGSAGGAGGAVWASAGWVAASLLAALAASWYAPLISAPAALRAGRGALVAAGLLATHAGLGSVILGRLAPGVIERPGGAGHALMVGVGVHGVVLLPLLVAGVCTGPAAVLVLGVLAIAAVPGLIALGRLPPTKPRPPLVGLLVALLMAPALFDALAPATDTDELSYLLAIPRLLAREGALPTGILSPETGRPLPLQLVAVAPWVLGGGGLAAGEVACRLWHFGVVCTLLWVVGSLVEARRADAAGAGAGGGHIAVLALAGSWSVVREAGLAYNDLPVALWLVCAADAMLAGRWRLMGLHAGFAFAAKYSAAPVCLGLFAVAGFDAWRSRGGAGAGAAGSLRRLGFALVLAALPVVPWWIRNVASGVHPLFPFAGWPEVPGMDFVFVYPAKYGLGREWLDTLLLPFNLLFRAEPDSMVFYGRLSLLWAGLLAIQLRGDGGGPARRLAFLTLFGVAAWAAGAQIIRYLLPVLGIGALLLGTARLPRLAWVVLFVASLPANLGPAWRRASAQAAVATGQESADAYLSRELPMWSALRYARTWIPADDQVALLGNWGGYYMQQRYVLGSVEDHVPTRYWLALHGDDALHALARTGVRWLIVGDLPSVRKAYHFLDESTFNEQFRARDAQLERLLLRDARRVYQANHTAIWRMDGPIPLSGPPPLDGEPPPR